jgi:Asp-tRNA(Asn)/Glu-tRNA(Gln) amidotransferase A subunit family amidase
MPFGFENGLPIGLQLMSKIGTDLSLLELGQKLDQMHVISKISFNRLNI